MVTVPEFSRTFKWKVSKSIEATEKNDYVVLDGVTENWGKVVNAGKIASRFCKKEIVTLIECKDLEE